MAPALLQNLVSTSQQPNESLLEHDTRQPQVLALHALLANTQGQNITSNLQLGQIDTQGLITLLAGQGPTQPQPQPQPQNQLYQASAMQQPQLGFTLGNNSNIQDILSAAIAREQQKQAIQQILVTIFSQSQQNEQSGPGDTNYQTNGRCQDGTT
jgi:hypothetical protein